MKCNLILINVQVLQYEGKFQIKKKKFFFFFYILITLPLTLTFYLSRQELPKPKPNCCTYLRVLFFFKYFLTEIPSYKKKKNNKVRKAFDSIKKKNFLKIRILTIPIPPKPMLFFAIVIGQGSAAACTSIWIKTFKKTKNKNYTKNTSE